MQWLSLLRRLSAATAHGGVWKNADTTLSGVGDVDFATPRGEWDAVRSAFEDWRTSLGIGRSVECRHRPGSMYLLAIGRPESGEIRQLDVRDRVTFRGSTLFEASDLGHLMFDDSRGFRRLRPGAEAVFTLLLKCVDDTGAVIQESLVAEGVPGLVREDPVGFREALLRFGSSRPAMLEAADRLADGGGADLGRIVRRFRGRALLEPRTSISAAWFRFVGSRLCPLFSREDRADPAEWASRVERSHGPVAPMR